MQLRIRVYTFQILVLGTLVSVIPIFAQDRPAASSGELTVERIYSQPSLSGRRTRGIAWTPDNKKLSFFETKGTGKDAKADLWLLDTASGERSVLIPGEKLETILPAKPSKDSQATGLG